MFIPDGTDYEYGSRKPFGPRPLSREFIEWIDDYKSLKQKSGLYSWGWIGNEIPSEHTGWSSQDEKQKVISFLKSLPKNSFTMHFCGWHDCEICGTALGTSSLCIFHNGKEYRAPSEVVHYIEHHDYNPGGEVVEALFNGKIRTYDEERKEWEEKYKKLAQERRKAEEERIARLTPEELNKIKELEEYYKKCQAKISSLREHNAFVD